MVAAPRWPAHRRDAVWHDGTTVRAVGQTNPVDERSMGVEEELLLVDPESGQIRAVSQRALQAHDNDRVALEHELFLQQIETGTIPCQTGAELRRELVRSRRVAAESAESAETALVAVGTSVLAEDQQRVTPKPRYERIVNQFGEVGRQAGVCGMHVHVEVDETEAVRTLDRMRPWLPVLRALSVNSPFWQGADTGYASFRSQVWGRWPTAGPAEPYGDLDGYRAATQALIDSGAALDRGMLYLDARLAQHYPTIEVRVFDVTTELDDVCLLALLTRALVQTVACPDSDRHAGVWRTDLLRAAHWRAARDGLTGSLVDPATGQVEPARAVVERFVDHVGDALDGYGDRGWVLAAIERLLARGTGASRQRAAGESGGSLEAVVADLRDRFTASYQSPSG